ncbi:MAG: phosphate ABC transporter substrate-binding protein PstS [Bacteroidota bacterium]|nr:phosphate ABC transporter substrate-binding protein PstS [Bacteroidota bacterium]
MKNILFTLLGIALLASCTTSNKESEVSITAAGATFPLPFYKLASKNYTQKTGTMVTYGGIGSGGGIRSLKDKIVDFGATDAFLSNEKEAKMPAEIVHIPTCIGAVVVAYNLPKVDNIKLSNKILSDIFMGKITKWNDPKIKENNKGINFPNIKINVVHRSDGSGTTYIFSDYMCKISAEWKEKVSKGKSLKWPTGTGAKGNPGVAGVISQTQGAIGYIGSEFAFAQKIQFAQIENQAGRYINPNLESITAAAKGEIPDDTKIMLTNSADSNAYPISGFTWLILYKNQKYDNRTKKQAEETVQFISWIIDKDAQALAQQVNYAQLPEKTKIKAKKILKSIVYGNEKLIK